MEIPMPKCCKIVSDALILHKIVNEYVLDIKKTEYDTKQLPSFEKVKATIFAVLQLLDLEQKRILRLITYQVLLNVHEYPIDGSMFFAEDEIAPWALSVMVKEQLLFARTAISNLLLDCGANCRERFWYFVTQIEGQIPHLEFCKEIYQKYIKTLYLIVLESKCIRIIEKYKTLPPFYPLSLAYEEMKCMLKMNEEDISLGFTAHTLDPNMLKEDKFIENVCSLILHSSGKDLEFTMKNLSAIRKSTFPLPNITDYMPGVPDLIDMDENMKNNPITDLFKHYENKYDEYDMVQNVEYDENGTISLIKLYITIKGQTNVDITGENTYDDFEMFLNEIYPEEQTAASTTYDFDANLIEFNNPNVTRNFENEIENLKNELNISGELSNKRNQVVNDSPIPYRRPTPKMRGRPPNPFRDINKRKHELLSNHNCEICSGWIRNSFVSTPNDKTSGIPREYTYQKYVEYCQTKRCDPVNKALFGKCFRKVFPNLSSRRLLVRTVSPSIEVPLHRNCIESLMKKSLEIILQHQN